MVGKKSLGNFVLMLVPPNPAIAGFDKSACPIMGLVLNLAV
jgi:hypothetical protein